MKRNGFVGREKRVATDRQLAETETDRGLFRPRSTADCLRTFVLGRSPLLLIVVSFQSQLHRRGVGGGRVKTRPKGRAYYRLWRKRVVNDPALLPNMWVNLNASLGYTEERPGLHITRR